MRILLTAGIIAWACMSGPVMAQTIDAQDPAKFATVLTNLGYKPSAVVTNGGIPLLTAQINDWNTGFAFSGCNEDNKGCKYVVLVTTISDLTDPPADWVNQINNELDLGKIVVHDSKSIAITFPLTFGPDGIPLTTFRYALDLWLETIGYVAQSAANAKLLK